MQPYLYVDFAKLCSSDEVIMCKPLLFFKEQPCSLPGTASPAAWPAPPHAPNLVCGQTRLGSELRSEGVQRMPYKMLLQAGGCRQRAWQGCFKLQPAAATPLGPL